MSQVSSSIRYYLHCCCHLYFGGHCYVTSVEGSFREDGIIFSRLMRVHPSPKCMPNLLSFAAQAMEACTANWRCMGQKCC